jgi:LAS superfamily LD-carboxypeptidase LdcB
MKKSELTKLIKEELKKVLKEEAATSVMRSHPGMVEEIIEMLKHIDIDGETMQYILKAVGMEEQMQQSFANVNRVEVIQHSEPYNGRAYTNYNAKDVEIQLQDDNKTLKIFLK